MKRNSVLLLLCISFVLVLNAQNRRRIDSMLLVCAKTNSDTTRINTFNALSFEFQKVNADSSLFYAKKALEASERSGYAAGRGYAYNNIGNCYYFRSDFKTGLEYYKKAVEIRNKLNNKKDLARSVGNIGNIYFAKGDYKKAEEYYRQQYDLALLAKDRSTMGDAWGNLANINMAFGNYDTCLKYNLLSLKIREELNDARGMDHSYNNIGGVYFQQGNYPKALEFIKRSLQLQMNIGNKKGTADSYHNLGSIYYHLDSLPLALDYLNKSLKITEELGDKKGVGTASDNIASIYIKLKQFDKAIDLRKKALRIAREIGDRASESTVLNNLGGDYTEMGNLVEALRTLDLAYRIGKETGAKYTIKNTYDFKVLVYKKLKDPVNALKYYERSAALGDSLLNEENTRNIVEMQTRYDTEKKEKEIEILQKDKNLQDLKLATAVEGNRTLKTLLLVSIGGFILLGALLLLIYNGNRQKKKANALLNTTNSELGQQRNIIEQKNQLITDSVDYAQTLIGLRLPSEKDLKGFFTDAAIVLQPFDVIGGCMFSFFEGNDQAGIIIVDCKASGIPGAFLALRAQQICEHALSNLQKGNVFALHDQLKNEIKEAVGLKKISIGLLLFRTGGGFEHVKDDDLHLRESNGWVIMSNYQSFAPPTIKESGENFRDRILSASFPNTKTDRFLIALKK